MKICERCGIEKKDIAFPSINSTICKKCNIKKQVEKSRKFATSESKGIHYLDKNKKINILNKYLRPNRVLSYDKAIEYIKQVPYIVYNEDTVYLTKMIEPESEDVLLRINVLERDNYTCYYCGKDADTVDHLIPKSKGGKFVWKNLVACCTKCNQLKSNNFTNKKIMKKILLDRMILSTLQKKNKWE